MPPSLLAHCHSLLLIFVSIHNLKPPGIVDCVRGNTLDDGVIFSNILDRRAFPVELDCLGI